MVLTQIFIIQIFGLLFYILTSTFPLKVNYSDSVAMLVGSLTIYQLWMFEH
jgi:hypothetical protein